LMLQIAREDFVEISGRESFKSNSQHVWNVGLVVVLTEVIANIAMGCYVYAICRNQNSAILGDFYFHHLRKIICWNECKYKLCKK
jgi:hypothetical protein